MYITLSEALNRSATFLTGMSTHCHRFVGGSALAPLLERSQSRSEMQAGAPTSAQQKHPELLQKLAHTEAALTSANARIESLTATLQAAFSKHVELSAEL